MAKDTVFSIKKTLNISGNIVDLSTPAIMGILNVTPDSFYDGGRHNTEKSILKQAEKMLESGTSIIDIGGYSSRPNADGIPIDLETSRVLFAIRTILKTFPDAILSIDTFRSSVAYQAVNEGASIINDISGGGLDPKMFQTVADLKAPYILMHMRGSPQNMTQLTDYHDLLSEMTDYFTEKISKLRNLGVEDIILDPGFGFSKTTSQNFELLKDLDYFHILERPVLVGVSRKSMIYKTLDCSAGEALNGTTVLNTMALLGGASILRVHDVNEAMESIKLFKIMHN